ncbi:MAG TPA: AMP-binding protein [Kofleriaceae bacterium]
MVLPERGHLNPILSVAQACEDAGHQLAIYSHVDITREIRAAGLHARVGHATGATTRHAPAADVRRLQNVAWLRKWFVFGMREVLTPEILDPLRAFIRDIQPDIMCLDPLAYHGVIAAENEGIMWTGISTNLLPLAPPAWDSPMQRVCDDVAAYRAQMFADRGVDVRFKVNEAISPWLNTVFTTDAFVPRRGSDNHHSFFVGPSLPRHTRGDETAFPWDELPSSGPIVYVSFGSQISYPDELVLSLVNALAQDAHVVITLKDSLERLRPALPANVLAVSYAPQLALLERVDVFITHGGANSVMEALSRGVPMMVLPTVNDGPLQGLLVERAGVGFSLPLSDDLATRVREPVRAMLAPDAPQRRRAEEIARSYARSDGPTRFVELVEELVRTRTPLVPTEPNFAAWLLEVGDADAPAVLDGARSFTYAQLRTRVHQIAALVQKQTTPVLVVGESSFEQLAAYLGVIFAGGVVALLPPMSADALDSVIAETGASLALCDAENLATVGPRVPHAVLLTAELEEVLDTPVATRAQDMTALMYTSGSTGRPRGVMVSTANLIANTRGILEFWPLTSDDRALLGLPLYYCYGVSVAHAHLRTGASVVLSREGNPERVLDLLQQSRATSIPGVPTLFELLLARPSFARRDLTSVRYLMISGGRLRDGSLQRLRAQLPTARVYVRYGVTELTAAASYLPPERLDDKLGSIGRGLPGLPLEVLDDAGANIQPGSTDVGQIVARGEHVALGYFKDEAETTRVFRDGAFLTGDLATVDAEGFIFIVGREREFVKTGGHRIAPQEIENVLASAGGVRQVAVVGVPDDKRGEVLVAIVVPDEGQTVSVDDLRNYCEQRLPAFKVPTRIELVDALPQTASGKIDRAGVRSLVTLRLR